MANNAKATKIVLQRKVTIQVELDEAAFKEFCDDAHGDAIWKAFVEGKWKGDAEDWGLEKDGKSWIRVIELPDDKYTEPETVELDTNFFGLHIEDALTELIETTAEEVVKKDED